MFSRSLLLYLLPLIAQAVSSFGIVAIFTRVFSDADYGRYSLVFTSMSLTQYLTTTWVEAAAARFYGAANARGEKPDHFATLLVSLACSAVAFVILAVALLVLWPADAAMKLALAAGLSVVLFRSFVTIALETRRMAQDAPRFALGETLYVLLAFFIGIVLVVAYSFGPEGPFLGMTIAALVVIAIEGPALFAAAKGGHADMARVKTYLNYGAPISGGLIIGILLSSGDRFLISGFLGEAAVGAYAAGFQVASRVIDMIFLWAKSAVTPVLIAAYERGGVEEARGVAPFGYALRLGIGAPAALGIAMLAEPICGLLIGESLRARATEIVPWIAAAALLLGMGDYFSDAFMLAKKTLLHTILLMCPLLINLTLNFVLLPTLGLRGAVIASVVAYGVSAILLALIGRRYVKLPIPLGVTGKIALACACMAGVLWALPDLKEPVNLIYKIGLGALTYGICAYVLDISQVRGEAKRIWGRLRNTGAASL